MEVDIEHKRQIEQIIRGMKCQKNFTCYKSRFTELCEAKDIGMQTFIECLDESSLGCNFSLPFGSKYFCKCPLRIYVSKKLKK